MDVLVEAGTVFLYRWGTMMNKHEPGITSWRPINKSSWLNFHHFFLLRYLVNFNNIPFMSWLDEINWCWINLGLWSHTCVINVMVRHVHTHIHMTSGTR